MRPERVDMGGYALTEDAPLAGRNTLRVAARAALLAEVRDDAALPGLFAQPALRDGQVFVLGEGSNVLFTRDYPGTVVHLATRGVEVLQERDGVARVRVAAGERWDDFVRWSLGQGFAGLENLILIPGTVGAAPIQNIGAYGVEVGEFVHAVEAFDRRTGATERLDRAACAFAYRDSVFKREPQRWVVIAVEFDLPHAHAPRLDYAGVREELAAMGVDKPAPYHVAEAVVRLRTRKLPDPAVIANAGSFFKNPRVPAAQAAALQREHPALPVWPGSDGMAKLSAAWLIEASGFKGLREGDAGISNRHALVLVNHGRASGAELWALAGRVREGVRARFGVILEPEPVIV
ncbi:UDP-N-acetylmuramate dehydrogenase [Mizugakiibacter sediminis]|uniref:UDP-N-acetylenolpyruvoylglucosamine reductase n=2 Tax=Mizugakiibacter sediminis TaxID=1475481 RepID=A0A0K8QSM1_9GAMM|nr:UDP-N-acetylmuramate dehydrogenase [Mizugakiibacter sediminis]